MGRAAAGLMRGTLDVRGSRACVAAIALVLFGADASVAGGGLSMGDAVYASAPPVYRKVDDRGVVSFSDRSFNHRGSSNRMVPAPPPPVASIAFGPRRLSSNSPRHSGFDSAIERVGDRFLIQPALVKAVVAAESNFNPTAVSHKGAQGLMQLMPATALSLGVENSFDPDQNLAGGARYLREMLDRYGDLKSALAAYNAGPDAVDRYSGIPPYRETKAYVARVLNYYRDYYGDFRP
jgi:soluble lytic murein transglycosylase-like protein